MNPFFSNTFRRVPAAALASFILAASWARAGIAVLDHQQAAMGGELPSFTMWASYDASSASKLVISVSSRNKNGNLYGGISSVTYNGVAMTEAIQYSADKNHPGSIGKVGVFYLDHPGAAGPIVVNWAGATGSGCVASLLKLTGTLDGVKETNSAMLPAANNTGTAGVPLTPITDNSLVVAHHFVQGTNPLPTANAPLTGICSIASSYDSGAAGYELVTPPATVTPAFTTTSGQMVVTVAAAFAPVIPATPYNNWAGGTFPSGKTLADIYPGHDADGGGLPTGIEWVTGGDPTNPADDASHTPTCDNTSDPIYFIFTYRRTTAAHTDPNTTIKVEYGGNLSAWTTAVEDGNNVVVNTYAGGGGPGVDLVQVKIKRSLVAGNHFFARLNVTVTSP